jgi:phosphoserine phosphatase
VIDVHITVSGPDHPGITAKLTEKIHEHQEEILDMGQAVTHGLLSLSMVLRLKADSTDQSQLLKDMLFDVQNMGLNLTFQELKKNDSYAEEMEGEKFILNCVSTTNLSAEFINKVSNLLADSKINILRIDNVNPKNFEILEIATTVPADYDLTQVKAELLNISNDHEVDIAFLKDNVFRRSKRLIVFDMDSTLIQTEVIDEIAELCGIGEKVKAITESAMNGEIDFDQSLTQRVGLLEGLETSKLDSIIENLPYTPGVREFIKTVKKLGYKVAIISGGFTYFANAIKEELGIDYAFANELEMSEGKLTGKVKGAIVNAEQKETILRLIAQQEQISLEQVVAIGDGANDLPMLSAAGLGIAFHAKQIVREKASNQLSHGPMTSILHFLGIPGVL